MPEWPNGTQSCHSTLLAVAAFLNLLPWQLVMATWQVTGESLTSESSCRLWRNASDSCSQMAACRFSTSNILRLTSPLQEWICKLTLMRTNLIVNTYRLWTPLHSNAAAGDNAAPENLTRIQLVTRGREQYRSYHAKIDSELRTFLMGGRSCGSLLNA